MTTDSDTDTGADAARARVRVLIVDNQELVRAGLDMLLAGDSVEHYGLSSLRAGVARAGADEFLFAGTIAENIAFARPDASAEEIEAAARRAEALPLRWRLLAGAPDAAGHASSA